MLNANNTQSKPVDTSHSALGRRVIMLLKEYEDRISTPSTDRNENLQRMKMLQNIVRTACPASATDLQTATDVVRIFFDFMLNNWNKKLDESTIFRMGEHIKATTAESDKITMFVSSFAQMVEGAQEKKRVMFVDTRLKQALKNENVCIAITRIRDNINKRNAK